ncbi:mechanosensitive ion channel family protein [Gloeothece verrucosa]|uniref:mechanosensitive ion channel family protein n=1 Tax=Gloeothece verrucosa TaxID=2546359 RepID=UPI0002F1ABCF|nr:mechanosensitive ion channel family protein [Gloeothece verrucosa]
MKLPKKANLEQRLTLNILLRQLLRIAQVLLWYSGIVGILCVFPETRLEGRSFIFIPLKILLIGFILSLINSLVILYLNHQLRAWAEDGSIDPELCQRRVLRVPTLLEVSRGIIKFVSLAIGTIWFLTWQELPLSWLTGAGLVGAALTFVFQNLLKDWVNGILIIFEDQYIVGDMVDIGGFRGIVEQMSLRATQVRGFQGGSLSTIPHNQITIVHNLSKDWAWINFSIEVAYETDMTAALELMKQIAQEMADDPQWQEDIIDPVSLMGVDRVAHSGIELMMWIKVKRLKQWIVEREFRRRLKLAFDQHGIQIGVPMQNLSFPANSAIKFSKINDQ